MAHSIKSAVQDFITTAEALTWLKVQTVADIAGTNGYTLSVTLGGYSEELHFGAVRKSQELNLEFFGIGPKVDSFDLLDRCQTLNAALIADRRRNTFAQSTIIDEWTTEGGTREGITLIATAVLTTNETT